MDQINNAVMLKKRPPPQEGGDEEEREYVHPTDRNRKPIPKRCVNGREDGWTMITSSITPFSPSPQIHDTAGRGGHRELFGGGGRGHKSRAQDAAGE